MSFFEVFCCLNVVVLALHKVFRGKTKYEELKDEKLLDELLKTFPKWKQMLYSTIYLFDSILDLISLIIFCVVVSRLFVW